MIQYDIMCSAISFLRTKSQYDWSGNMLFRKKLISLLACSALLSSQLSYFGPIQSTAAEDTYLIRDKWNYCSTANYVESEHFVIFYPILNRNIRTQFRILPTRLCCTGCYQRKEVIRKYTQIGYFTLNPDDAKKYIYAKSNKRRILNWQDIHVNVFI